MRHDDIHVASFAQVSRLLTMAATTLLGACTGGSDPLPNSTFGLNPALPAPQSKWLPVIDIAPAKGWKEGEQLSNGQPAGLPEYVLTGFVDKDGNARGRPVGVVVDKQGAVLVADDVGNIIWRVAAAK